MRNQLIFGGVKNVQDEPAMDSLKTFLHNIMKLTPENRDILDAECLGNGYSKIVQEKEIFFPGPIRARCSSYFAQLVMDNASQLAGKQDQEGGFKYYVHRSHPEPHRAV